MLELLSGQWLCQCAYKLSNKHLVYIDNFGGPCNNDQLLQSRHGPFHAEDPVQGQVERTSETVTSCSDYNVKLI